MAILVYTYTKGGGSLAEYFVSSIGLKESQRVILDAVISSIIVLIFAVAILVVWIYTGMISKINRLIYGANNIKEGNLEFSIATTGTDELSELINTFEDMKERLRADTEEKILTEKAQRELISNIAHDIKTPLTAIQGYAEGLLDGVADTEEKRQTYIRTISRKAEDLNSLLNELMVYSNISTNRIPYNFNHVNVKDYFSDLLDDLGVDFSAMYGHLSVTVDVRDGVEMIADTEQIRRVIENLVDNSVKYKSEKELEVEVRVIELEGFIQVEMEDNGLGIRNEDIPYIFDRTFRADTSRQFGVAGSGLGLSIAKKIIEDHGGRIWATSQIGKGTCFYFILRQYTLPKEEEEKNVQNSDNRRRRGNSRIRKRLSDNK